MEEVFGSSSNSKASLKFWYDRKRIGTRFPVLHNVSVNINKELTEVPRNRPDRVSFGNIESTVVLKVSVNGLGGRSIDIGLVEHRELYVVSFFCPSVDFRVGTGFLAGKLVAREAEDLESLRVVCIPKLNHFSVVLVGEPSISSNIHNQGTFGSSPLDLAKVSIYIPIDTGGRDFP